MKRDFERRIDAIDTVLTTPALIGSMFLLAFIASHSLVLAVAVGCVTWAAAWYFFPAASSGEHRAQRLRYRDSVRAAAWYSTPEDWALSMQLQANGRDKLPRILVVVFGFSPPVSKLAMGLARYA